MKLDDVIKEMVREELKRLQNVQDVDSDVETVGPKDEIDAIYHDSSRDDNVKGYTPANKPAFRVKIKKDNGEEL